MKVVLGSAIGIITHKIINGEYKICPKCGRIYLKEYNFCSMCEDKQELIDIDIKIG